jgi:phage gp29-like protein
MANILQKLFGRRRALNPIYDPTPLATTLTVSRIHAILETARQGDLSDLFTLYRDVLLTHSHIQAEFAKRKLALLGDEVSLQPEDPESPDDVSAVETLSPIVLKAKGWGDAAMHLMDSVLWPVAVVEKIFAPGEGGLRYILSELRIVPHQLLDFRKGDLRIFDVDESSGRALLTSQPLDPDRYIVHRGHSLSTADNHGGPMRAILFWFLFSSLSRDWWSRFLDRLGAPFMVGKYPVGDDDARNVLRQAISSSVRTFGIAVTEGTELDLIQAGTAAGDNYDKFVTLCNREISKLILGQTLSAEAQSTGLGSGVAVSHEAVRRDIRQFDATRLGETIRLQLLDQLMQINGLRGRAPVVAFSEDSGPEAAATSETIQRLHLADYQVVNEDLPIINKKLGFRIERRPPQPQPAIPFSAPQEVGAPVFFRRERSYGYRLAGV